MLEKANFTNYPIFGDPIAIYYERLDMSKLKAITKYDHRYLFKGENRTVYLDNCCHFNHLGMDTISDASVVFENLLSKN